MTDPAITLTPVSYAVLGLVATFGPVTSYELKRMVAESIGYMWAFPHTVLYTEPVRLAAAGLLAQEQEQEGRRRRRFTITDDGWHALEEWLGEPAEHTELRDLGLLKLFFGFLGREGNVGRLAAEQARFHRERLRAFELLQEWYGGIDAFAHQQLTVKLGVALERAAVEFWDGVVADPPMAEVTPGRTVDPNLARATLFALWGRGAPGPAGSGESPKR